MTKKIYRYLFLAIVVFVLSGCKPTHDLAYFENLPVGSSGVIPANITPVKLMPRDELNITVTSTEPRATEIFNIPEDNLVRRRETASKNIPTFKQPYVVDSNGDISFPVFGKIHVEGMTTEQLREYLTKRISETVNDPIVRVDLVNFKVKVLGEVSSPKTIDVYTPTFTIFDALAACGDLTVYARRDNVMVMRTMPDGSISYGMLDLHDTSLTSSPYFVLQQNDVIYATPNAVKQENSKYNSNNGFRLSVISTIVSASSVLSTLVIALVLK